MFDFDPLADANRYCVYCQADCWPEPESRQHAVDCPIATRVYPVTVQNLNPWGTYGNCSSCHEPFKLDDRYVVVPIPQEPEDEARMEGGFVTCLGCAALDVPAREI